MKNKITHFKSILEISEKAGLDIAVHPTFAIFDIKLMKDLPDFIYEPITLNFYTIGLKRNANNCLSYGRTKYDFDNGVLGFTGINQVLQINPETEEEPSGWMILIQREFLKDHALQKKIEQYGFFTYQVDEALHLSPKEEKIIEGIFENIYNESQQNIDNFSKGVILSYLELLLNYSDRFYNRQFITRQQNDGNLLERFEESLNSYFVNEKFKEAGIPGVSYFADHLRLSSNYLSDYLKTNTGKSTHEHIQLKLIEQAKIMLLSSNSSVSEIAFDLGFEYPQYFSRLFSKKTGVSPKEFRLTQN